MPTILINVKMSTIRINVKMSTILINVKMSTILINVKMSTILMNVKVPAISHQPDKNNIWSLKARTVYSPFFSILVFMSSLVF